MVLSSTEDALERTLGCLTEEEFANVRVTHSVPGKKGPHVAALDVITVVTKTTQQNVSHHWNEIKKGRPEVTNGICNFRFPGQGQREVDVVSLPTALQVKMLLPGKAAAAVRLKASVLLVRYLAGDLTLVGELYGMHSLQECLKQHCPEHPLAMFREAVSSETSHGARKRLLENELEIADLESKLATARRDATVASLDAYTQISNANDLDDRERIALRARITSGVLRDADGTNERCEISLTDYLRSQWSGLDPKAYGRALARRWRERHPDQVQPTKRMVLENGALVTDAKLYFEEDRELMDEVRTELEATLPKKRRRGIR